MAQAVVEDTQDESRELIVKAAVAVKDHMDRLRLTHSVKSVIVPNDKVAQAAVAQTRALQIPLSLASEAQDLGVGTRGGKREAKVRREWAAKATRRASRVRWMSKFDKRAVKLYQTWG